MTSASELFCSRRTRLGRVNADPDLESTPDLSYTHRHHQLTNRCTHPERRSAGYSGSRRQGLDGCIPLRRPSHTRMPGYRTAFTEWEPFEVGEGTIQNNPANSVRAEGVSSPSSRSRVTCSERLPGAVLQARERLLQRLRGVAVSDRRSRRLSTAYAAHTHSRSIFNDDFRLVDAGDWDTDIFIGLLPPTGSSSATSLIRSDPLPLVPVQCKKPAALTQEALSRLTTEIFNGCASEEIHDHGELVSWDCSICLERFNEGNELVRLPCSHRFHLACLGQWGRICGDCPCCRRSIT
uniref:RING-type domain-containing protein n=1 Tax=Kalanchoe fedtschenkoi TaxID=63787 RepID=A0A7N0TVF9_KALFE